MTRVHVAAFFLLSIVLYITTACGPLGKEIAKSAIDVALAACVSEHADLQDEEELREVCKWTDEMAPYVKELLSARAKGLSKARAACAQPSSSDAGTD